jgi:hypothetical protein
MPNQPKISVPSQLPIESEVKDLAEEELMNVTGGGLIRTAGHGIADGAKASGHGIEKAAKASGHGIEKAAKATWKFIY